jgi:hypothetical protein
MALTNRERVGRALSVLSSGLAPFIEDVLTDVFPVGVDSTGGLASLSHDWGVTQPYDREDVQTQLYVLSERVGDSGYPFDRYLPRAYKSLVSELETVRDQWASSQPFSGEDTYRALDTTERLLRAVSAVRQADEIRSMRVDLQRRDFNNELTRTAREQRALAGLESVGLPSWRTVLIPHADVAAGRYATSEFAADLHQVAFGSDTAGQEYRDPVEFFRRTYLTGGLRDLLSKTAARLGGDLAADPVINLQTNFGGGKTHSMLAVWHLVSGRPLSDYPQEVQDLLLDVDVDAWAGRVRRVALVGNEIPPNLPIRIEDGVEVNTLWGELAWQLGGRAGYDLVGGADTSATNPGAALKQLLARYAPCVILIDEWVAYARGLYTRHDLRGGTFDTQFSFAQALTEAVAATPGVVLLVSIPASDIRADQDDRDASDLEIGGVHGREALKKLQNVIGRASYEWRAASSQESFEIVRRRLFTDPDVDSRAKIALVASRFGDFYRTHHGEFPRETLDKDYETRMKAAYPIHPELFDRLYEDWSTLERFQRTRGVLRLMSAVVHTLSTADDPSPLIMPGSVPLDAGGVRNEVAKYLEDNWNPILDADVDGDLSTPARIDRERPLFGQRALTRRIARALFLGSAATLRSANKGIERQRLFLGVAQPGDTVGNFGSALQLLGDNATYLYSEADRYWYDTQPSLNRKAAEYADGLTADDVWAEIVERLRRSEQNRPGDFTGVDVAPAGTVEVGEPDGVRLVLLHPRLTHTGKGSDSEGYRFAEDLMTSRGAAPRERRNLLVALGPDAQRYAELDSAVRANLAWRQLAGRIAELDLTRQNEALVNRRRDETNRVVDQRIPTTYIWLFHPAQDDGSRPQTMKVLKVDGAEPRLAVRTSARLVKEQMLLTSVGVQNVRLALDQRLRRVWNDGRITVGDLWDYYRRYPYLDRLRDRLVLDDAVRAALDSLEWHGGGFALAEGYDETTGDFAGLVLPGLTTWFGPITDTTLLVDPRLAQAQADRAETAEHDDTQAPDPGTSGTDTTSGPSTPVRTITPTPVRRARYSARLTIKPDGDIAAQLKAAAEDLLAHLAAGGPEALDIVLDVHAERLGGFDEQTARTVTENGTTLGFTGNRFEDGT